MLEFAIETDPESSRLSCQIICGAELEGLVVTVPLRSTFVTHRCKRDVIDMYWGHHLRRLGQVDGQLRILAKRSMLDMAHLRPQGPVSIILSIALVRGSEAFVLSLIDVHSHVTPSAFPPSPTADVAGRWPCMRCTSNVAATLLIGDKPFRELDNRSWDVARRIEDMDRDGVALQVLSPMPELLSYWLDPGAAAIVCMHSNVQIAEMIAAAPARFKGLGAVPLQDPGAAAAMLPRLHDDFGLSGVEIGSNINGIMLGDSRFDVFWQAAEDLGMAVFVHALHPVAVKSIEAGPLFTAFAGFPIDVAMAAASLITSGTLTRFPRLRVGFSHGGGALGSILGRLDKGWSAANRYGIADMRKPSEQARALFYDSNVYDPVYLNFLATRIAPGQVFVGTDYPYQIMQEAPADFVALAGFDDVALQSLHSGAAKSFLGC